jgi:hypothetical protein
MRLYNKSILANRSRRRGQTVTKLHEGADDVLAKCFHWGSGDISEAVLLGSRDIRRPLKLSLV